MFSKAEMQQMKREFWIAFAEAYPRKWLLYDTKIKDFSLKFDADRRKAMVMIEIGHRDEEKRRLYYEKLESLQTILQEEYWPDAVFDPAVHLETGKEVARVYVTLEGVGISNRSSWPAIFDFFHDRMAALEMFFYEFEDFIKDV